MTRLVKHFVIAVLLGLAARCAPAQSQPALPPLPSAPSNSAQQPRAATEPKQDEPPATTLTVNVKLVNMFVTVVDQNGAPVGSLDKDSFQLFEDGIRQNIAVFDRESE